MTSSESRGPSDNRPEQHLSPEQLSTYLAAFDKTLAAAARPDQTCPPNGANLLMERWGTQYSGSDDTGFFYSSRAPDGTTESVSYLLLGEETNDISSVHRKLDELRRRPGTLGRTTAQFIATHPRTGVALGVFLERLSSVNLDGRIEGSAYTMTVTPRDNSDAPATNFLLKPHDDVEPWLFSRGDVPDEDGVRPELPQPDLSIEDLTALLTQAEAASPNHQS